MPNQDPTQNQTGPNQTTPQSASPPAFFPQEDIPPMPPAFQDIPEDQPTVQNPTETQAPMAQEPNTNTGSAAPNDIDISSVIKPPKKKFGTGKIIATILGLFVLIGGVGAGIALTQQQQLFQQKASSCAGTCRVNCNDDEKGQGLGSGGCPSDQYSCVPNSCSGDPDAGTSCVNAGFHCVSKGSCPAGFNQAGSCNTANTDCCSVLGTLPPQPTGNERCIFDNYQNKCSTRNPGYRCDVPKGEYGISASCTNTNSNSKEPGCTDQYPNCNVAGTYCHRPSECVPSDVLEINCVADPTCGGGTATPKPTPTSAAPYCVAVKAYSSDWTLLTNTDLSALTTGSVVNFCVNGFASSGTFDKAQFTINGTQLAETTVLRAGSTDYCQSYTILSTDKTVSVTAKIHHSTLNWF